MQTPDTKKLHRQETHRNPSSSRIVCNGSKNKNESVVVLSSILLLLVYLSNHRGTQTKKSQKELYPLDKLGGNISLIPSISKKNGASDLQG
jgi:hypothetical protein